LGLPSGLFPSSLPTNNIHATLFSRLCSMPLLDHLHLIVLIIFGKEYTFLNPSICSLLQPPTTSSLFNQNIFISTLFSNTLSLCSFLNIRDQASHQYRTTGKITVLYILIFFPFFDGRQEDRRFWIEC
jgi:hypothetical protein